MKIRRISTIALAFLGGCADMSGLGGTKHFACKAPAGVHCESLSATYHNSIANRSPAQRSRAGPASKPAGEANLLAPIQPAAAPPGLGLAPAALRIPGREMRIWIKAWQDEDRDLVDQSYVYLVIDSGQWRVAHVQQRERDAFARVVPRRPTAAQEAVPSSQPDQPAPVVPALPAPAEVPAESVGK